MLELFSPIDRLSAERMLEKQDEELLALFAYLAAAFRQGHLFVEKREGRLEPTLEPTLDLDTSDLVEAATRGFEKLKESSGYFVKDGNRLYLARAWSLLQEFSLAIKEREAAKARLPIDEETIKQALATLLDQQKLLPQQAAAIHQSITNSLSCIWGGPGTGKTYTAGWLVRLFLQQHPHAKVALAAPTGKAAAQLAASIRHACSGLQAALEPKTLHALLNVHRLKQNHKTEELAYDLILVDESSMIDLGLACKLLGQHSPSSRLVFLGDPNQLPPIEAGEPFCAMVQARKNSVGMLVTSKRQTRPILDLAESVLNGTFDEFMAIIREESGNALSFEPLENNKEFVKALYIKPYHEIQAVFSSLNARRLLCPLREGKVGTVAINQLIMRQCPQTAALPILITKNDYQLGLTNGQVGCLLGNYGYFEDFDSPGAFRKIPHILLPPYETAYCLSVHKSQGSEFDEVILLLPEGSERFGRKMLYTAITRAKKTFRLFTTEKILRACLAQEGRILRLP